MSDSEIQNNYCHIFSVLKVILFLPLRFMKSGNCHLLYQWYEYINPGVFVKLGRDEHENRVSVGTGVIGPCK